MWKIFGVGLLLAAGALRGSAQQAHPVPPPPILVPPGGQRLQPAINPVVAARAERRHALAAAARAALNDAPAELAPWYLLQMADAEREDAEEWQPDLTAAFHQAHDLAFPASDADLLQRQLISRIKQQAELQPVAALALAHFDDALALARQADIPRGPLYDALLSSASAATALHLETAARNDSPPSDSSPAPSLAERVTALVEECKRSDGSFPYRGLQAVLARLPDNTRPALIRYAYQSAAQESEPAAITAAASFMSVAHGLAPSLDNELETAILSLLDTLARQAGTADSPQLGPAIFLLGLLRGLDAPRADEFAAQFPAAAALRAPVPRSSVPITVSPGAQPVVLSGDAATLRAQMEAMQATRQNTLIGNWQDQLASATDAIQQVRLLAQLSQSLAQRDPATAAADLDRALALATPDFLAGNWSTAMRLAPPLQTLGRAAEARDLIVRCSAAAEASEALWENNLHNADAEGRAQLETNLLGGSASGVLALFSVAAQLDPDFAARLAAAFRGACVKPLIFAELAQRQS